MKHHVLAAALVNELVRREKTVATAESCTGGWVAKCLTDVAGSSAAFEFGWVSYANRAKTEMLGVPATTLETHGAVSEPVVAAMAAGAKAASGADYAVAISGIAGPGGGSPDKPVGLVWFGWAVPNGDVQTRCWRFEGDRNAVRTLSCETALEGVLSRL
ncbi:MAG: nicotinamide-nucleotide amidohydrolase family protein [Pseudomonadota bacterium]